jgi:hypothetical protein
MEELMFITPEEINAFEVIFLMRRVRAVMDQLRNWSNQRHDEYRDCHGTILKLTFGGYYNTYDVVDTVWQKNRQCHSERPGTHVVPSGPGSQNRYHGI